MVHLNEHHYWSQTGAIMLGFNLLYGSSRQKKQPCFVLLLTRGLIACGLDSLNGSGLWSREELGVCCCQACLDFAVKSHWSAVLVLELVWCCIRQWALSRWLLIGMTWRLRGPMWHSVVMSSFTSSRDRSSIPFIKLVLPISWQSCKRIIIHVGVLLVK